MADGDDLTPAVFGEFGAQAREVNLKAVEGVDARGGHEVGVGDGAAPRLGQTHEQAKFFGGRFLFNSGQKRVGGGRGDVVDGVDGGDKQAAGDDAVGGFVAGGGEALIELVDEFGLGQVSLLLN